MFGVEDSKVVDELAINSSLSLCDLNFIPKIPCVITTNRRPTQLAIAIMMVSLNPNPSFSLS